MIRIFTSLKKVLMICVLILFGTLSDVMYADTCPDAFGLNPLDPPAGWKLLLPPVLDGQEYEFGAAIHSLNGGYYYGQVICKYQMCPSHFCPAFTIISEKVYEHPNTNAAPWDARSVLGFTLTCLAPNHDPAHCVFS